MTCQRYSSLTIFKKFLFVDTIERRQELLFPFLMHDVFVMTNE